MHNCESHDVVGTPLRLLRAEGLVVLALAIALYWHEHFSWLLFVVLFLVPDISMLGYLAGPRVGAMTYNALHTFIAPVALGVGGIVLSSWTLLALSLIWTAHIGCDRFLGYGFKYPSAFVDTHLGRIGAKH